MATTTRTVRIPEQLDTVRVLGPNDEVIREHLDPNYPVMWAETSRWDDVYSHDRLWS